MYPSFLFCVGILNEFQFRFWGKILNLGQLNEVVNSLAVVLQMKAGILKCVWQLNDGLPNIVDLLLRRNL
jgi:hypothetical protein